MYAPFTQQKTDAPFTPLTQQKTDAPDTSYASHKTVPSKAPLFPQALFQMLTIKTTMCNKCV